jgi:hypothetical protein
MKKGKKYSQLRVLEVLDEYPRGERAALDVQRD